MNEMIVGLLGMIGIMCHNLMKMDSLNRKDGAEFTVWKYLLKERFSILLSIFAVTGYVLAHKELVQIEQINSKQLISAFVFGLGAQSIIVWVNDKRKQFFDDKTQPDN